ncbi:MAG: hypothetical protein JRJ00_04580 [Deltaproteobacteria bacterium]|nr:hypothetical protein [Deltaproteobacteria bacterium]
MKRNSLITIIVLFIGLFFLATLSFAAEEKTEEIKVINKIVTVGGYEGAQPSTLNSGPGTT